MARILVLGGDGAIGSALARAFADAGEEVISTTRHRERTGPRRIYLDLASAPGEWPGPAIDAIYLCAGETSIARCEADPAATHAINVDAPAELIRRAPGAFVVVLSTSAVFDGRRADYAPNDAPAPQHCYGTQKVELERLASELTAGNACVLRLGKVLSRREPLFRTWVDALSAGAAIDAFDDVPVAPVALDSVVALLQRVHATRPRGIFHYTASSDISYRDAARALAREIGAEPSLVRGAAAPAGRAHSLHAMLDSTGTARTLDVRIPTPQASIAALAQLEASPLGNDNP